MQVACPPLCSGLAMGWIHPSFYTLEGTLPAVNYCLMTSKDCARIQLNRMRANETKEQEFLPGNVVLHRQWGVGHVIERASGAQADLVVDFPGKPRHRMSSQLASYALSKLPSDGLEALLLREPDKVATWGKDAPLKLIGATLADLGGAAKPAEIRAKLEGRLVPIQWASWWKRVQPALKDSAYFLVHSDGSYYLTSTVEQIPERPLPPSSKKVKAEKLSSAQVKEIVASLEAGETKFESLKGATTLSLAAKELVQECSTSERAQSVVMAALQGPVLHARVVLQELLRLGQATYLIDGLRQFIEHIQLLVVAPAGKEGKKVSEHVKSKLHLFEKVARHLTKRQQLQADPDSVKGLMHALLQLALAVWRQDMSSWRSESLDCISNTVVILAKAEPKLFNIIGEYLATKDGNTLGKIALTDSLFKKVNINIRRDAVDKLLTGSLVRPSEFFEECFLRHIKEEEQLSWISSRLPQILSSSNIHTFEAFARLLVRKNPRLEPQEIRTYLSLLIAIASVNPQAQAILSSVIRDRLKQSLDEVVSQTSNLTRLSEPRTVLDFIEAASYAKVAEEREKANAIQSRLESNIEDLQLALKTTRGKSAKLDEMVEQLKSSYRLPEQWALFQGKKEVLASLVAIYQEAFLAKAASSDLKVRGWVLQRLQNLLQRHGVSEFGQVDSCSSYNPALHEFILGFEETRGEIRILCPGFEWQDLWE